MAAQTQTEVSPDQYPLAAQIPLSSFTLPAFPPAASRLRSLTLTSDINLNDYQLKHLAPGTFEPSTTIPSSITHLTLELFSLGFPGPFLKTLATSLPNLQSLTLFSCLIDGVDDRSRQDASSFFKTIAPTLRELHIVDTFTRVGFWKEISSFFLDDGLKALEVSYTYRGHCESDFLNRTAGDEWSNFLRKGLIGMTLNFASPPVEDDLAMKAEKSEDQEDLKAQDGILPYASDGRASQAIVAKLKALKDAECSVLNLTMFAVIVEDICGIVSSLYRSGSGIVDLSVSVLMTEGWYEKLVEGLAGNNAGKSLESLEVVGVPISSKEDTTKEDVSDLMVKDQASVEKLAVVCPQLSKIEMTILKSRRIGAIVWQKKNGWVMAQSENKTV